MQPTDDELRHLLPEALALADAPDDWVQRAIGCFQPAPALLQRVQALLRFDSWAQPAQALALRQAETPDRQLIFDSPLGAVEVRIVPSGTGFSVGGQMLSPGRGWVSCVDSAAGAAHPMQRQPLSDLGEFHLEAVPAGAWRLSLWLDGQVVELPVFEVPPPHTP